MNHNKNSNPSKKNMETCTLLNNHVKRVSAFTWQRGGGGLGAGGTQQLDVRGMKPASLPLLAPSLEGRKKLVRRNRSPAASLLNSNSRHELILSGRGAETPKI